MKYVKKPVVVDAVQWFEDGDHPEVILVKVEGDSSVCKYCKRGWNSHGRIERLHHGSVCPGDYIIEVRSGIGRRYSSCKRDIFEATYDPVVE